jgi:hypothetical protein
MSRPSLALLALTLCFVPALAAAQDFDPAGEQAMLERINAVRAESQLPPLARASTLDAIARGHSVDMAAQGNLSHVSPTTGTPEDRIRRAGVSTNAIAENVAMHRDTARAMEALLASPAHRGNILSPHVSHIGLGSVRAADGVYVTQLFAALPADAAPSVAAAEIPLPAPTAAPVEAPAAAPVAPPVAPVAAPAVATPAAAPVAEAPAAPAALDPTAIFGIIPPFVEQVLTQLPAVPGVAAPSATPAPPVVASAPAPTTPSATPPAPTATVPAASLRQLVDLAQALLGNATATPAQ